MRKRFTKSPCNSMNSPFCLKSARNWVWNTMNLNFPNGRPWSKKIKSPKKKKITIAIVGKYFKTGEYQLRDSYAALMDAIDHAAWANDAQVKTLWIDAEKVEQQGEPAIPSVHGLIVPIGWGERGSEGMIAAAGFSRRNKIHYLGL